MANRGVSPYICSAALGSGLSPAGSGLALGVGLALTADKSGICPREWDSRSFPSPASFASLAAFRASCARRVRREGNSELWSDSVDFSPSFAS